MKKIRKKTKVFLYLGIFVFSFYFIFLITPESLEVHIATGLFMSIMPVLTVGSMGLDKTGKAYKKIVEKVERAKMKNSEIASWTLEIRLIKKREIERMAITFLVSFLVGMIGSMIGIIDLDNALEEDPPSSRFG